MTTTHFYPPTVEAARAHFQAWVPRLQARWPQARWRSRPVEATDTTLTWLEAPATHEPRHALLLSAGLHGIEGHVGAAMLDLFLRTFADRLDARTTGLYVLPVLNPWGMAHGRRVNAANVDLNRNFWPAGQAGPVNADYAALHPFLNPTRAVQARDRWLFWPRGWAALRRAGGLGALRRASLQGQSQFPQGIFFAGQAEQPETRAIRAVTEAIVRQHNAVVHVDMHTGFGPRGVLTLILPSHDEDGPAAWRERLGYAPITRTAGADLYPVQGAWQEDLGRQARAHGTALAAVTFEFGTLGHGALAQLRSLRAVMLENQCYHYGAASPRVRRWVQSEFRALFAPDDPAWRARAAQQARRAFAALLDAWARGALFGG